MSYEIEASYIGHCLISPIEIKKTTVIADYFDTYEMKQVFEAMKALTGKEIVFDMFLVSDYLHERDGMNWAPIVNELPKNACGSAGAASYRKVLEAKYQERITKVVGEDLLNGGDPNEAIRKLMLINRETKKYHYTGSEAVDLTIDDIEARMSGGGDGVESGLADVDTQLGCFHNTDLIVVAARSAIGKTAFMLQCAVNAIKSGSKAGILSTEQGVSQATTRMICQHSGVELHKVRSGEIFTHIEQSEAGVNPIGQLDCFTKGSGQLRNDNWVIYDKSGPTISEIEQEVRRQVMEHSVDIVYIDYLQRIRHDSMSMPKHEALGDIAMRLKGLARELNIPVFALAQVNRTVDTRPDKRPTAADINGSVIIEMESDQVIMLYRDEVYNPEDRSNKGICEVLVKKNRHGKTGCIPIRWNANYLQFKDFKEQDYF